MGAIFTRLDYTIAQNSEQEIGEIVGKLTAILNKKQMAKTNELNGGGYKKAFYATLFDPRSKKEFYVFCDYLKTELALKDSFLELNAVGTGASLEDIKKLGFLTKDDLAKVMRYKGSVANKEALPKENNEVGDVYNLLDTGLNVAYDGENWDEIGGAIGSVADDSDDKVTLDELKQLSAKE